MLRNTLVLPAALIACTLGTAAAGDVIFSDDFSGNAGAVSSSSPEVGSNALVGTARLDGDGRLVRDDSDNSQGFAAVELEAPDVSSGQQTVTLDVTGDFRQANSVTGFGFVSAQNQGVLANGTPLLRVQANGNVFLFEGPGAEGDGISAGQVDIGDQRIELELDLVDGFATGYRVSLNGTQEAEGGFSGSTPAELGFLRVDFSGPGNTASVDSVSVDVTVVPEPGALGLSGLGLVLLAARRRKG